MTKILKKGLILWLSVLLTATLFPLAVPVLAQTAVPGGSVSGTWTAAGSPYLIEGDITVPAGQTLTIEAGVEVIFQSWYKLTVNGTLLAEGNESQPILFTGSHATAGWLGIRFIDAPDGSLLTHAIVEKGRATGASPEDGGGGIYIENSNPTISYSTIRDNFAKRNGGGLYLVNSNARLTGNTISNNSAGQGASAAGGGIYMLNSNPELTDNVISGNWVYVSGSYTTPTGAGGGIFARSSNPVLRRNLISNNRVDSQLNSYARGGGLYLYYADADLINNTITGNTVGEGGGVYSVHEGGGLFLYQSDPTIVNTILWNDTPQEIFVSSGGVSNIITVAYSDLQGGQAAIVTGDNATLNWLAGNIDADPLFVDAANGDYGLQSGSPAIDAGTAFFEWQGRVLVDLSPAEYVGAAPDMGAFEFGGAGGANQPPVAVASASPDHGSAPLTVQLNSDGSFDPDGTIATYAWDFGDGGSASAANPTYTYTTVGTYQATLTVTDDDGASHSDVVTIDVMDGTTIWGGDVSGTWGLAGSPYRIEGDVTVPTGQTLTIEPGVVVNFQSAYEFTVNGTLLAEGTENAQILFGGGHATAGWSGIRLINASDSSRLTYVVVEKGRATSASSTKLGGGIYIENSNPTISHSTIRDNYATLGGGGIALVNSNARLVGNTVINNSAGQGASASGGGIYMLNSNPELTDNVISGNWVYVSGSYTTPTGAGGGIFARSSNPVLRRNLISNNRVDSQLNSYARGGGLYLYYADADLINNTITGNTVGEGGGVYSVHEGGGLFLYQSDPTIVNTILWNDTPEEIFVSSGGVSNIITVAYSDLQGGQAAIVAGDNATVNWLTGNIDADPLFVDAANGDYGLQAGSPAIDAGTATFEWQGRVLVDLAPSEYIGAAPDMGALESDNPGGGQNQAPVAVASASPNQGSAPLLVQFSSDGSYDPDGSITSYAWDFGDGSTASQANPSHTFAAAGIYQATLTVTDDGGATDSASVTVTVTELALHVGAQTVTREKVRNSARGVDTILILDQDDQPVAGATVTALYDGPSSGQVSGTTGADGTVVLMTSWVRRPKGTWCFEVTGVLKDGYVYNPDANLVTVQCES